MIDFASTMGCVDFAAAHGRAEDLRNELVAGEPFLDRGVGGDDDVVLVAAAGGLALGRQDADDGERHVAQDDFLADRRAAVLAEDVLGHGGAQHADLAPRAHVAHIEKLAVGHLPVADHLVCRVHAVDGATPVHAVAAANAAEGHDDRRDVGQVHGLALAACRHLRSSGG
jgi:hypothetical protein